MNRPVADDEDDCGRRGQSGDQRMVPEGPVPRRRLQGNDIVLGAVLAGDAVTEGGAQQGGGVFHVLDLALGHGVLRHTLPYGCARLRRQFAIDVCHEQLVGQLDHGYSVPGRVTGSASG